MDTKEVFTGFHKKNGYNFKFMKKAILKDRSASKKSHSSHDAGRPQGHSSKKNSSAGKGKDKPDFTKIVDKLSALAQKKGHVTYEQIQKLIPDSDKVSEHVEEIVGLLSEKNIEIISSPM